MKLGRIIWTPVRPLYKGSTTQVTYGSINGLQVMFVMGNDDDWSAGPRFDPGNIRVLKRIADQRRPSMESAKRAGRRFMETYLSLITVKEEE